MSDTEPADGHTHLLRIGNANCYVRGVSKKFGEWYQKTNKTEDTKKLPLLAFKIIAILHDTLLATFIKLLETVSKGLFKNLLQNCCHTFLDCRHVCKTRAFHDALQAGKQKEVHRTPLIWHLWAPAQGSTVGGLLSVSPSEEHHEKRMFCRHGGNPRTCDSGSAIDS
jgi:hypothetical protein